MAFTLAAAAPPLPQQSRTTGIENTACACCSWLRPTSAPAPPERGGVSQAAISRSCPGDALMVGPAADGKWLGDGWEAVASRPWAFCPVAALIVGAAAGLSRERGAPEVGALLSPRAAMLPRPDDAGRMAPAYSGWAAPDNRAWLCRGGPLALMSPHLLPADSAMTDVDADAAVANAVNEEAAADADMPPSTRRAWVMGLEVPGRAVWPRVPVEEA